MIPNSQPALGLRKRFYAWHVKTRCGCEIHTDNCQEGHQKAWKESGDIHV